MRAVPRFKNGLRLRLRIFLFENLEPYGVAVIIEAEHLCMTMRGARAAGSKTQTSALRGIMRTDAKAAARLWPC